MTEIQAARAQNVAVTDDTLIVDLVDLDFLVGQLSRLSAQAGRPHHQRVAQFAASWVRSTGNPV